MPWWSGNHHKTEVWYNDVERLANEFLEREDRQKSGKRKLVQASFVFQEKLLNQGLFKVDRIIFRDEIEADLGGNYGG